jgi:hypothetical protein
MLCRPYAVVNLGPRCAGGLAGAAATFARKTISSIHAVELRLIDLIRSSRFVNEVCVESGDRLFKQVGKNQ